MWQYKDRPWAKYMDDDIHHYGPRIRSCGLVVWALIGYYKLYEGDKEKVLYDYRDRITAEELDAALAY